MASHNIYAVTAFQSLWTKDILSEYLKQTPVGENTSESLVQYGGFETYIKQNVHINKFNLYLF
jgi:hypothetical protein